MLVSLFAYEEAMNRIDTNLEKKVIRVQIKREERERLEWKKFILGSNHEWLRRYHGKDQE